MSIERRKQYMRKYRELHKQEINLYNRKYQKTPKFKEYLKEYVIKNRERFRLNGRNNYAKHREKYKRITGEKYIKLREKLFEVYGSKCACCGESHKDFLTLDHIKPIGKSINRKAIMVYYLAIKEKDLSKYQILCFNCNCLKRNVNKRFCKIHHPELYS